jgi:hypothetical protein
MATAAQKLSQLQVDLIDELHNCINAAKQHQRPDDYVAAHNILAILRRSIDPATKIAYNSGAKIAVVK